jgi:hypothetical protein
MVLGRDFRNLSMKYSGRISENHDRNETKPMTDSGYITETAMDPKI